MGNLDRGFRIGLAILFAILYFAGVVEGTVGIILLVLAGVFLLTSIIGFCPLYLPLKISTIEKK